MGAVHFSLDIGLVKVLKSVLALDVFVETGTFKGDTVENIKKHFSEIHSVELSEEYFNYSKERFKNEPKIKLYLDHSSDFLKKNQAELSDKSILYWLDAHWCVADKTAGQKSQCPLLDEIKAIKNLNIKSVIIIDDARLFTASPPAPHEISQWPDFNSVMESLKKLSNKHETIILNDTIIFYPLSLKHVIRDYAYQNSVDWLEILHKNRDYDNLRKHYDDLHMQFDGVLNQLKEKDEAIYSLSDDLKDKEEKIIFLSDDLIKKEKEIDFLSESLSILKKRLSTPIWGMLTLFQHHFPSIWEFVYRKKQALSQRLSKQNKKKLKFLEPKLGKLHQYEPRGIKIPVSYLNTRLIAPAVKLSIVTPSYNQADFLERTILSVLDQKYPNLEYIIKDGGSLDKSSKIIIKYEKNISRAILEKDKGQAEAINIGFKYSSGQIMAWINSDDIYLPGTFNYVINYFNKHPKVDVVYGHRILIDVNDREIGRWVLPPHDIKVLYWADFIPQETLFWRREIWNKVGGNLNDNLDFAFDWDLLLRFQENGARVVRLPRFLAAFRVHSLQKTSAQIQTLGNNEMEIIRDKYLKQKVTEAQIKKSIATYLVKSEIYRRLTFN